METNKEVDFITNYKNLILSGPEVAYLSPVLYVVCLENWYLVLIRPVAYKFSCFMGLCFSIMIPHIFFVYQQLIL